MTVPEIAVRPVEAIQGLYQQAGCPTQADGDWGVVKHFEDAIEGLGLEQVGRNGPGRKALNMCEEPRTPTS